jgi:membrane-associated phospholipid phosphatase
VTVPLAVLTCCFLVAESQLRLALVWSFAILGCAGVVGLLKLLLTARGPRPTFADMLSPSGHTAMSTAIYGSLSLVIARSSPPVFGRWSIAVGSCRYPASETHGSPYAIMRRQKRPPA